MNALMKMNYQKGRLLLSAVHIVAAGGLLKSHGVISANHRLRGSAALL